MQFASALTIKTYSTSMTHTKLLDDKPDGYNFYKTLITLWNTFLDQQTLLLICCCKEKTLTRGWTLLNHMFFFPITSSHQQKLHMLTKFSLKMTQI